ncbi:hypothetical protein SLEP1_g8972 [Rubroshorea leprosula]|uniref:Uncharacterized protein n=1 Tax=Rubroshorea leprosula TaxID=152421 RepID=A0AAV5IDD0_9ROSI|nr:hypothetical protein SLEP1_g8972 [Rubroshorea leprosula]
MSGRQKVYNVRHFPPGCSAAGTTGQIAIIESPTASHRRVLPFRDYPKFCGRDAPYLTNEVSMLELNKNENLGQGKKVLHLSGSKNQLLKEDSGSVQHSSCPWRQGKKASKLELPRDSPKRKGKKYHVYDDNDDVVPRSSYSCKDGSSEGDHENSETASDRLLRHGLMASSNCLWKQRISPGISELHGGSHRREGKNHSTHEILENDVTARSKVREILRLFQAVCRKLLQEKESGLRGGGRMRVDYEAAGMLKNKWEKIRPSKKIIGPVPGVEIGDEFQYVMELFLIGLHCQTQNGIDYVKQGDDIIATSIIASGGYDDDLDNSDVLSYMGQGGNVMHKDRQPEDQKLKRGNLALATSKLLKTPVRVIRGEARSSVEPDARGKLYTYYGLYLVEDFWKELGPHGKLVFKFKLVRIPGQPEVPQKVVKKSRKSEAREGVCVKDISQGKELFPICAINMIDSKKPPTFGYVTRMVYPDWFHTTLLEGCHCTYSCSESGNCSCVMKNGGQIPYTHDGAIVREKPLVYECGPTCKCPPSCHNRVSQHGIKFELEIFRTKSKGWGVRSLNSIPSGSFICEYVGELLTDEEAEQRTAQDEYLFDIGNNYSHGDLWDGLSALIPDVQSSSSSQDVEDSGFTLDAAQYGNVARFINHSCSPNLYAQNVLYDHQDKRVPHVMLFATENITPLQELTYHYNCKIDQVYDAYGNTRKKSCFCGSSVCTGRIY